MAAPGSIDEEVFATIEFRFNGVYYHIVVDSRKFFRSLSTHGDGMKMYAQIMEIFQQWKDLGFDNDMTFPEYVHKLGY